MSKNCKKTKNKFKKQKSLLYHGNWTAFFQKRHKKKMESFINFIYKDIDTLTDLKSMLDNNTQELADIVKSLEPFSDHDFVQEFITTANEELIPEQIALSDDWETQLENKETDADETVPEVQGKIKVLISKLEEWSTQKQKHIDKLAKLSQHLC